MRFAVEKFTAEERAVLERYFTNLDKPVFALVNLPEVVKGALFARYSRSNKSLRRLFLDEFHTGQGAAEVACAGASGRAEALYDKMILDFGDDSVAQLGGAHVACEQVSNIMTKVLERGRIASYLEQSTRYVPYNEKVDGRYRYVVPAEIEGTELEAPFRAHLDMLFETYTEILDGLAPLLKRKFPRAEGQSERAWEATIRAKALDIARGLLPAATRSNMGIYASGQSYEYMLVKMYASDNQEVIAYADMILAELRKVIPSLLTRVDLEDRGRAWSRYLRDVDAGMAAQGEGAAAQGRQENSVRLTEWDADARERVVRAAMFEYSSMAQGEVDARVADMTETERNALIVSYCGTRLNRRHKPGRAFEMTSYTFEVESDYGAFRDLQRHRLLTIQWQKLSPRNGWVLPVELDEYPDLRAKYERALAATEAIWERVRAVAGDEVAQYVVPFAFRVRYRIAMNLREAFHFIELRTQRQGHYSYRRICAEMYRQIVAHHPFVADCMVFVDLNTYDLARADAENKRSLGFDLQ
jgi:thymidylate synthase ThyX